ncbi:hypothetical protein PoB_001074700 [Plakobranchus ocellatus]|uniref:Uncharacterized protein n=1 Tax=Plakobranchus ocellatus TaxID=259542 RepID=A0AAV3YMT1_9GAST|nr:hypothetical protein PoB_001074700 [Plakobranchus ocellatus]
MAAGISHIGLTLSNSTLGFPTVMNEWPFLLGLNQSKCNVSGAKVLIHAMIAIDLTVDSESALKSVDALQSGVRALPPAPWPDGESESLRSLSCGLAV